LGGTIVRKLVESGKHVRTLVLPNDKSIKYIPKEVEIIEGDLCDMASVEQLFNIPDSSEFVCLHIASIVSVDYTISQKIFDVNVGGTKNIINMCLSPKCKKLVYCSSTGAIKELPKGEKIKEVDSYNAEDVIGSYSQSKAIASQAVIDAVKKDGLKACIVLPSGIFGPGDYAMNDVTKGLVRILNGEVSAGVDGSFNLCDVRDLADGCINAVEKGRIGESYILANNEVSFRDFVTLSAEEAGVQPIGTFLPIWLSNILAKSMELIAKISKTKPVITSFMVYNLSKNNCFDYSKAEKELGYHIRSFRETIKDEIQWLRDENLLPN